MLCENELNKKLLESKAPSLYPGGNPYHVGRPRCGGPASLAMLEELTHIVSNLKIDDKEVVLELDSSNPSVENKLSLVLFGRPLTYNIDAFKRTITGVWPPSHILVIRVLSHNFFAFQFFHWRDMNRVLEGRP